MDVFKLPGDELTATSAITHYIANSFGSSQYSAYLVELQNSGESPERGRNPNSKDARGWHNTTKSKSLEFPHFNSTEKS